MNIEFPTKKFKENLGRYRHQYDFLRLFDSNQMKFFMLKWARRHGKSTMTFNILIRECLKYENRRYAFIFTTYKAAKNIITKDPDMMSMLPKQDYPGQIWSINHSDLTIKFVNGSVLQLYGADKPDSLRGFNAYGCAIDEWSQHRSDKIWTEIVNPVLTNNGGWCIFIYTPCGINHASEMYNKILSQEMGQEWYCSMVTAEKSGLITKEELEKARLRMGDLLYRQEFLCEDLADDDLVIIPQRIVNSLGQVNKAKKYLKRCIAIDPALTGDECMCYFMVNSEVMAEKSVGHRDTTVITANIIQFANKCGVKNIVIDSIGIGKGPCDQLKRAGFKVIEFVASEKAEDKNRFLNLKAEAWFNCRQQMEMGNLPPVVDMELKKQLSAVRYEYSGVNQRIKCEPKVVTKQRLGRSPDRADAYIMGVWAYKKLPDENQYKYMSNLDRMRFNDDRGVGSYNPMSA